MKVLSQGLVIRQGDSGDRCYIVINGIVDVYIKKESELNAPPADKEESKPTRKNSQNGSADPAPPSVKDYGDMVANLGPGAMFGEVVLLDPTAKRNATIIASQYTESCELICLERADYTRLVRTASMEASHYNHAEILDQMHLFQGWDKHGRRTNRLITHVLGASGLTICWSCLFACSTEKMRLVSAMRSMNFISNVRMHSVTNLASSPSPVDNRFTLAAAGARVCEQEYLYRAGSDAKWLFVITSGEVMERLNLALSSTSDPMQQRMLLARSNKVPEKKVNIELALIGPGDIAGELPFVKAKWIASFDIKAVTDVQTLAIDRRYYESNMMNATAGSNKAIFATLQKLKKISLEREDWRQQRLECGSAYPNAHISM